MQALVPCDLDVIIWGFIHESTECKTLRDVIPIEVGNVIQKFAKWTLSWDDGDDKRGDSVCLISEDVVLCGPSDCTATSRNVFSGDIFESITFELIAHSFSVHSYFGFVEYPDYFKGHALKYRNKLVRHSEHSSVVVTSKSSPYTLYHYESGQREQITLKFGIKDGAHFIFAVDFVNKQCNLYIDEMNERRRIYLNRNHPTWSGRHFPHCLVPCYSHYGRGRDAHPKSEVLIKLHSYKMRK